MVAGPLIISVAGTTPLLRAFSHPRSTAVPYEKYAYAPPTLQAAVASSGHYAIAVLDPTNGSLVSSTPIAGKFMDDALMPGCNAGVDVESGVFYKTTTLKRTFQPSSDCGSCKSGSVCCKDPTDQDPKGFCLKTSDCSNIPAGAGSGGQILTINGRTGAIQGNVTLTPGVHPVFGAFNKHDGLLYSIVPYSYTEYGLVRTRGSNRRC
jgi:hypothetical protein